MGGACNMHGRDKKYMQSLVRNPDGKRLLGRPGCGWGDVDWIHFDKDRD
jgi:hypothetical protein